MPGAAVSIVKDGQVSLIQGYGYADLERKIPVDPYTTLFRLGSISKLVTATAVMQLSEEGRINLQEDIKRYIPDLKIDYIDGKPITAHHLLTHTAGFYESIYAVGRDRDKMVPLSDAIMNDLPGLVRKPGEQVQYSNQGMSLAGYLVEKVSRQPYEDVIKDRIFKPLKMNHSNFQQQESESNLAKSYTYANGAYKPAPYSYIHHPPAGALTSTVDDMTHFMIAHLQQGQYEGGRILSEKTADDMHRTQFTAQEKMPGMAYGFYERYQNGLRLIEHDGGIDGYLSYLFLIPVEKTGIFISTNSSGGGDLIEEFIGAYLDRFYPVKQAAVPNGNPTPLTELRKMDGYYIPNRAQLKGPFNFTQNLSAVHVKAVEDGVLSFHNARYKELEPYLFQKENAQELLYLDIKNNTLSLSSIPTMMYEHKSKWYNPNAHMFAFLGMSLIYPLHFIFSLVRWLISLIRRKRYPFNWLGTAVSGLFIVYFLFAVSSAELLMNEITWWSYLLLDLPLLLLFTLLVRLTGSLVLKKKVTSWQYAFAVVTAIFVFYMYTWDFFSL